MYTCKGCGCKVKGEHTISQIMDMGKLCHVCKSDTDKVSLTRKKPKKPLKFKKPSRAEVRNGWFSHGNS